MSLNTTDNDGLALALARLRKGQEWLLKEWKRIERQDLWTGPTTLFSKGVAEWERLEKMPPARWSVPGCGIRPDVCHYVATIR